MALDPQQQIVTIMAPSANDGIRALLEHLDRVPDASIVSIAFATRTYKNAGTVVIATEVLTLVAVIAYAQPVQPGQVPPHIQIDVREAPGR